jgi:hypothetical protein
MFQHSDFDFEATQSNKAGKAMIPNQEPREQIIPRKAVPSPIIPNSSFNSNAGPSGTTNSSRSSVYSMSNTSESTSERRNNFTRSLSDSTYKNHCQAHPDSKAVGFHEPKNISFGISLGSTSAGPAIQRYAHPVNAEQVGMLAIHALCSSGLMNRGGSYRVTIQAKNEAATTKWQGGSGAWQLTFLAK